MRTQQDVGASSHVDRVGPDAFGAVAKPPAPDRVEAHERDADEQFLDGARGIPRSPEPMLAEAALSSLEVELCLGQVEEHV